MAAKFVSIDHDSPLLLPPDLRDWLPDNHMVHFIMDAVNALDLSSAQINVHGSGSAQYPPSMMLGLLIYSYSTGTFSSRRIETLTFENVAVRYLCADTHPDHDSICTFRRKNKELLSSCFHQVLELAVDTKVLKVGNITVAIDGTKILANASKHSAMSHGHLEKQMELAEQQIAQLLAKAEGADSAPLEDGLSIPDEIKRREDRIAELKKAKAVIEERAKKRFEEEATEYQEKLKKRKAKQEATGKKPRGRKPKPPEEGPRDKDQYNFTDPESRIMKTRGGFEQGYNAQAAVEVDTMLVVGQYVTDAPNDKQQLAPGLDSISPGVGPVSEVLVDTGYYSEKAVLDAEGRESPPKVYAAMGRQHHGRSVEELEKKADPPEPLKDATVPEIMKHRLETKAGKELYGLRKQTVEPVFGIIKEVLGFRRFSMRGLANCTSEWNLVTTSYNLKKLFNLGMRLKSC